MRADHTLLAVLACLAMQPRPARAQAAAPPVITCTSLANLRMVLRNANENAAAALPVITDPKSDLGCTVLDRGSVTGISDHVALNGRAYDCLALQGTSVCHWTVAGAAKPAVSGPAGKSLTSEKAPAPETGRR